MRAGLLGWGPGNGDPGALIEEEVATAELLLQSHWATDHITGRDSPYPPFEPENSGEFAAAARTLSR